MSANGAPAAQPCASEEIPGRSRSLRGRVLDLLAGPIILKELIQAAHHRRTFVFRTLLPVVALAILTPQLVSVLSRVGEDWRSIVNAARPLFNTCVWVEWAALSLFAFSYATAAIANEWQRRTMDLLCSTPISTAGVVYGKFAAVMGKALAMALALLPILGVWFHLARLPREVAGGSVAVVLGGALLLGSFGMVQASAFRFRSGNSPGLVLVALPYYVATGVVGLAVWPDSVLLTAAFTPRALYRVLAGSPPVGLSTGQFAGLTFGLHAALSAAALALAPSLFAWTLRRYREGGVSRRRRRRAFAGRRRGSLGAEENPFRWQERGRRTRAMRWAVPIVYACLLALFLVLGIDLDREVFVPVFAFVGLFMLFLVPLFYGAGVFAQEKVRRTAQPLLLTGASPWRFYAGKIAAGYRALLPSMAGVSVLCVLMFLKISPWSDRGERASQCMWLASSLLLAPLASMILGFAFSVVARTPQHAAGGLLSAILWAILLGVGWTVIGGRLLWVSGGLSAIVAIGGQGVLLLLLLRGVRSWTPWRLGFLLALGSYFLSSVWGFGLAFVLERHGDWYFPSAYGMIVLSAAGLFLSLVGVGVWLWIGLRLFDRGMAGEPASLFRRVPRASPQGMSPMPGLPEAGPSPSPPALPGERGHRPLPGGEGDGQGSGGRPISDG